MPREDPQEAVDLRDKRERLAVGRPGGRGLIPGVGRKWREAVPIEAGLCRDRMPTITPAAKMMRRAAQWRRPRRRCGAACAVSTTGAKSATCTRRAWSSRARSVSHRIAGGILGETPLDHHRTGAGTLGLSVAIDSASSSRIAAKTCAGVSPERPASVTSS